MVKLEQKIFAYFLMLPIALEGPPRKGFTRIAGRSRCAKTFLPAIIVIKYFLCWEASFESSFLCSA